MHVRGRRVRVMDDPDINRRSPAGGLRVFSRDLVAGGLKTAAQKHKSAFADQPAANFSDNTDWANLPERSGGLSNLTLSPTASVSSCFRDSCFRVSPLLFVFRGRIPSASVSGVGAEARTGALRLSRKMFSCWKWTSSEFVPTCSSPSAVPRIDRERPRRRAPA